MNLEKIIEEVYDRGPAQYPAYNAPPRKDFAPIPTKDGYNYQNQRNFPTDNLTTPPPDASVAFLGHYKRLWMISQTVLFI